MANKIYLLSTLREIPFKETNTGKIIKEEGLSEWNRKEYLLRGDKGRILGQSEFKEMIERIDITEPRLVGVFNKKEDAEYCIINNSGDICELNYYKYAVIETIEPGLYPIPIKEDWFKLNYDKEYSYEKIDKPKQLENIVCFYS